MDDMSGEYASPWKIWAFSASRNSVQIKWSTNYDFNAVTDSDYWRTKKKQIPIILI
jgi:hypothetical protein